jgi:hypothetical protein
MNEKTKKIIDELNEFAFQNKIEKLLVENNGESILFRYCPPRREGQDHRPAQVETIYRETKTEHGFYCPDKYIHIIARGVNFYPYSESILVYSNAYPARFRGMRLKDKKITLYLPKTISEADFSEWENVINPFEVDNEVEIRKV